MMLIEDEYDQGYYDAVLNSKEMYEPRIAELESTVELLKARLRVEGENTEKQVRTEDSEAVSQIKDSVQVRVGEITLLA